jgi:hypothetical protein
MRRQSNTKTGGRATILLKLPKDGNITKYVNGNDPVYLITLDSIIQIYPNDPNDIDSP